MPRVAAASGPSTRSRHAEVASAGCHGPHHSPQASRADLREIWLYIAQDSIEAADRLLDRLDRTIHMLANNPAIGERQDELRAGLRRFVMGNYLIFYETVPGGIRVVRVLHGARRWQDEL